MSPQLTVFKHEWSKHGTCYSTLRPTCLPRGSARGAEAVIFFRRVIELFQQLPTYEWLAQEGITPSNSKTYTISQLLDALKSASGVRRILFCSIVLLY